MKQKLLFSLQVFTTLIVFLAIFISYLVRGTTATENASVKSEISNTRADEGNASSVLYFNPFTSTFEEVDGD
jgi:hypothetical protein